MAGAAGAKTSSTRPMNKASSDDGVICAFDPRSRGDVNEKNMPAFNPPVQKHSFAERRDRDKAGLHRLRRFATECGMNIAAMKKPGGDPPGFRMSQARSPVLPCLEHAEHDGADKGEGDIGGYDAQLTDERTKGHGNPPKVISIVVSLLGLIAPLPAITHKVAIGFIQKSQPCCPSSPSRRRTIVATWLKSREIKTLMSP